MLPELFGPKSRREFLRWTAAGVFAPSLSGWLPVLAKAAPQGGKGKARSCILLWMDGGPSHKDTFDPKPDSRGAGEFKTIPTKIPGVHISEHLPKIAQTLDKGVIVRSMTTPEGAHARAKYYMHTGYREGQGGIIHPSIGSIVAKEIGNPDSAMPNYVAINSRTYGAGFLGPRHQPLLITDPNRGVEDLKAAVTTSQLERHFHLLEKMERAFHRDYDAEIIYDHHTTYQRAFQLMFSQQAKAFDLSAEPASSRNKYGTGRFAEAVLMARRLVEVGVPFVEVSLGGWDTHQNNFTRVKTLSAQIDTPIAALIDDLKDRGLLDSTLIVWMGEFGRTPHINNRGPNPGRDHYPRAWSTVLWGGGIRGGATVGKTDKEGAVVVERPVTAQDFLATICELLGIDHTRQNETPNGRPIRIVEKPNPFTSLIV
jgi:hypothetical protein